MKAHSVAYTGINKKDCQKSLGFTRFEITDGILDTSSKEALFNLDDVEVVYIHDFTVSPGRIEELHFQGIQTDLKLGLVTFVSGEFSTDDGEGYLDYHD